MKSGSFPSFPHYFARAVRSALAVACAFSASLLTAEVAVYEGFQFAKDVPDSRFGWSSGWGTFAGESSVLDEDLSFDGLDSTHGAIQFSFDTVGLSQVGAVPDGLVYGGFRVRGDRFVNDSFIGMVVCDPDDTEVKIDLARMGLVVKGWRWDYGALSVLGKKGRVEEGVGVKAGESYLVLFKIANAQWAGDSMTMWICNRQQVATLVQNGFDEAHLKGASIGPGPGQVSQRLTRKIFAPDLPVIGEGSMLCFISRFGARTTFDEIRISGTSLAEAAGMNVSN